MPQATDAHDRGAEKQVIGACLLQPELVQQVSGTCGPDAFWYNPHRWALTAMCELAAKGLPVSIETVTRRLQQVKVDGSPVLEQTGGNGFLTEAIIGCDPSQVDYWAGVVLNHKKRRDIARTLADVSQRLNDSQAVPDDNLDVFRAQVEERLANLSKAGQASETFALSATESALEKRLDKYINDPDSITGLETGWTVFDSYLDGLQGGNVSIVYAPTSRYKSLFTQNVAWRLAQRAIPGLLFTTEMPRLQVHERLLQLESGLNLRWLRRRHQIAGYKRHITDASHRLSQMPIFFNDKGSLDTAYIASEVSRQRRWNGIQYVVVDLVDKVGARRFGEDPIANMSVVMDAMKNIAIANDLHILLVSHITKGDKALAKRPELDVEDMKGSSSKYQDVDCAISLMPVEQDDNGDWYGLTRLEIAARIDTAGELTVMATITKNRHGETGRIPFHLDMNKGGVFTPLQEIEMQQGQLFEEEAKAA